MTSPTAEPTAESPIPLIKAPPPPPSPPPAPAQPPNLIDILSIYPIFTTLCSRLQTPELLAIFRLSRRLQANVKPYSATRWCINKRLAHYVKDPLGFRAQMAQNSALITGGLAVQFFADVKWKRTGLNIYVREDAQLRALAAYLEKSDGYVWNMILIVTGDDEVNEYEVLLDQEGENRPQRFRRRLPNGNVTTIEILVTEIRPIDFILRLLSSTCVLNAISWNKAYSFFPIPTFLLRKTYDLLLNETHDYEYTDEIHEYYLDKYRRRGWRVFHSAIPPNTSPLHHGGRHVGDSQTWTIRLDTAGIVVPTSTPPDDVLENFDFECKTRSVVPYQRLNRRAIEAPHSIHRVSGELTTSYIVT